MSALNCRPGDLAVVVSVPPYAMTRALGSVVRCLELVDGGLGGLPMWHVDPPAANHYWGIGDRWLRPIRDPGEDARDETLDWLPLPVTTKDAA